MMAKWRRGHRGGHVGPLAQAWAALPDNYGEIDMAAGGSVTTAYTCKVVDEVKLKTEHTPRLRTECARVDDAAELLLRGQEVVVAGSDMGPLRSRLASFGIG